MYVSLLYAGESHFTRFVRALPGLFGLWLLMALCAPAYAQTGRGLNFDGVDDVATLPLGTTIATSSAFTVEAWISRTASITTSTNYSDALTLGIIGDPNHLFVMNTTNQVGYAMGSSTTICTPTVAFNTWTHVALVVSGNTAQLYVNGVAITCAATVVRRAFSQLILGGASFSRFRGSYDEVRVWNVARTATEIAGSKDCELNGNESGLIAYYPFNQGVAGGTNTGLTSLSNAVSGRPAGVLTGFALTGATSNWVAPGGAVFCTPAYGQGKALNFDGVDDVATLPLGTTIAASQDFTIETLVNWSGFITTQTGFSDFITLGATADGNFINIQNSNAQIGCAVGTTSSICPYYFPENLWTHMALVVSGNTAKLYINGALMTPCNIAVTRKPFSQVMLGGPSISKFGGTYDDVRVWNVARTAAQISASRICELRGDEAGLLAYYHFNQGVGGGPNTGLTSVSNVVSGRPAGVLTGFALTGATSNWVAPGGATAICRNCNLLSFQNKASNTGLTSDVINSIVMADEVIYAATDGGLSISEKGRANFPTTYLNRAVNSVAVVGNSVYAGTPNDGLFWASNKTNFTPRTTAHGLPSNSVNSVIAEGNRVYVATLNGLGISTNGGQSFRTVLRGLNVVGVFVQGNKMYAAVSLRETNVSPFKGQLYISDNAGQSFTSIDVGTTRVRGVVTKGNKIYVYSNSGVYRYYDTSPIIYDGLLQSGAGSNLDSDDIRAVLVQPGRAEMYVVTSSGVFVTVDDTRSFVAVSKVDQKVSINSAFAEYRSVFVATNTGLAIPAFMVETKETTKSSYERAYVLTPNTSVTMIPSGPNTTYAWNTGATTRNIPVSTSGIYSVTATGACAGVASVTVTNPVVQSVQPTVNSKPPTTGVPVKTATVLLLVAPPPEPYIDGGAFAFYGLVRARIATTSSVAKPQPMLVKVTGPSYSQTIKVNAIPGAATPIRVKATSITQPGSYTAHTYNPQTGQTSGIQVFQVN